MQCERSIFQRISISSHSKWFFIANCLSLVVSLICFHRDGVFGFCSTFKIWPSAEKKQQQQQVTWHYIYFIESVSSCASIYLTTIEFDSKSVSGDTQTCEAKNETEKPIWTAKEKRERKKKKRDYRWSKRRQIQQQQSLIALVCNDEVLCEKLNGLSATLVSCNVKTYPQRASLHVAENHEEFYHLQSIAFRFFYFILIVSEYRSGSTSVEFVYLLLVMSCALPSSKCNLAVNLLKNCENRFILHSVTRQNMAWRAVHKYLCHTVQSVRPEHMDAKFISLSIAHLCADYGAMV